MPTPYFSEYFGTKDPRKQARWGYQTAVAREPQFWDTATGRMGEQEALEDHFRRLAHGLYDPMIEGAYRGGPGYTPEERAGILGAERLEDLQLRPGEREGAYLTPEEQIAIAGSPDAERAFFNPELQFGIQREATARQREALGQTERGMAEAIDPSQLRASPGFMHGMAGNIAGTEAAYGEAIDPEALTLSGRFQERYPMSDEEQARIVGAAATDVGNRYAGYVDRLKRAAASAGSGFRGMPALEGRMRRESAIEGADALTRARIAADREAAGREQIMEGMRLGAERGLGGMRMGAARDLGNLRFRTQMGAEGTRLGAEQGLADRLLSSRWRTGMARLGTERGIGDREQRLAQDIRDFGAGQQRYIEAVKSGRAGDLARQRLGAHRWGADERFRRGAYRDESLAGRWGDIGRARRADERETRGWATGQQGQAGGQYNIAGQQRIQGFGTATDAANRAINARTAWAHRPKAWHKLVPEFGQAAKTVAGGGSGGWGGVAGAWGGG